MVSEGRNQASTAATNLLCFSQCSNKTNIQIFKITIQLVCQRPCWQISAVKCTWNQGGHIFEKLNSLSFPRDFQGILNFFPEQLKRGKFNEMFFCWRSCPIFFFFPEFSRFFLQKLKFPWDFNNFKNFLSFPGFPCFPGLWSPCPWKWKFWYVHCRPWRTLKIKCHCLPFLNTCI